MEPIIQEVPAALIEEVFGLLFAACDVKALSKQEQQQYTNDAMTTKWDRENILYTKWLDGKEAGLAEGRAEEKITTARNFKSLGVDTETIMKATGLSKEEVEAL